MNIDLLKGILLGVMALTTLVFGLIPIKVRNNSKTVEQKASFIVSLLSCFAGGVFLSVSFLDLLPEAYWKTASGFDSDYPYVPLFFSVGFFMVKLLEEVIDIFLFLLTSWLLAIENISIDINPCFQETTMSVASLFCGIMVHKAVVSFSVGMKLAEAHPQRRWLVVVLIVAVALVTPLGGVIGIVIEVGSSHYSFSNSFLYRWRLGIRYL
ncbi:unnamed protein product [Heligmosomoides polygyrus]|uniref:Na_H_Exchanger domain-containing protein n=1 Tax=Heligmosomoides polygyrus TaxID=6339 RepID=A0A3P7YG51_HELPZ|nr:unnamed protein product [Heligmosomoides polygyrus]